MVGQEMVRRTIKDSLQKILILTNKFWQKDSTFKEEYLTMEKQHTYSSNSDMHLSQMNKCTLHIHQYNMNIEACILLIYEKLSHILFQQMQPFAVPQVEQQQKFVIEYLPNL